jgi:hypothetical protein
VGSNGALARALGVASALWLASCSFDSTPGPSGRESDNIVEHHGDSGAGMDASPPPPNGSDHPDAEPPAPPDAEVMQDARPPVRPVDSGMDATPPIEPPDAAPDSEVDADLDDDAEVVEPPDSGNECPDEEPACVCPEDPLAGSSDPCAPAPCAFSACAPDDDCEFLSLGSRHYYFCDDQRTWEEASEHCAAMPGLHLVEIDDEDENEFIFDHIADKTWLGGHDGEGMQEGRWRWNDGRAFYDVDEGVLEDAFVDWYFNEPNNQGLSETPADCMMFWFENGDWADASCGDPHGYVCEVEQ